MESPFIEREVSVTQALLRRGSFFEGDEEQVKLSAICRLDAGVVVAEFSLSGAMIERGTQLDAEIPRMQDQRDLGPERVWRGQHRVQLAQDRYETRDLLTE